MNAPPLLHARELSSIRAGRELFANLTVTVNSGDLIYIAGPNGAGKSTLLRTLAGLLPQSRNDASRIEWYGEEARIAPDVWQRRLLFLGHKAGVKGELTALENIQLQAQLDGAQLRDPWGLLETIGLLGLEDIPAQQLSAGQQRRIALTRLWTHPGQVWILDEPFTALDQAGMQLLEHQFERHRDSGGAIILTSHQRLSSHLAISQEVQLRGGQWLE